MKTPNTCTQTSNHTTTDLKNKERTQLSDKRSGQQSSFDCKVKPLPLRQRLRSRQSSPHSIVALTSKTSSDDIPKQSSSIPLEANFYDGVQSLGSWMSALPCSGLEHATASTHRPTCCIQRGTGVPGSMVYHWLCPQCPKPCRLPPFPLLFFRLLPHKSHIFLVARRGCTFHTREIEEDAFGVMVGNTRKS